MALLDKAVHSNPATASFVVNANCWKGFEFYRFIQIILIIIWHQMQDFWVYFHPVLI